MVSELNCDIMISRLNCECGISELNCALMISELNCDLLISEYAVILFQSQTGSYVKHSPAQQPPRPRVSALDSLCRDTCNVMDNQPFRQSTWGSSIHVQD
jgi:hypothetical protein